MITGYQGQEQTIRAGWATNFDTGGGIRLKTAIYDSTVMETFSHDSKSAKISILDCRGKGGDKQ